MEDRLVLTIDIGNTRTKFGVVNVQQLQLLSVMTLQTDEIRGQLIPTVIELFEKCDKSFSSQIIIASCNKILGELARNKLSDLFADRVKIAAYLPELPFKCNYKKPSTLGIDRLALALYGHTVYEGKKVVLISAGTAVTIDIMVGAEFLGGTILPGVQTQLKSLNDSTDALPYVSILQQMQSISIPAMTTEECIGAGVLYGLAGAIDRIVKEYKDKFGSNLMVLSTGGDWDLLHEYISFECQSIPYMTLLGTALFSKYLTD